MCRADTRRRSSRRIEIECPSDVGSRMALQSEDEISRQSRLSRRAADGQTDGAAAATKKRF